MSETNRVMSIQEIMEKLRAANYIPTTDIAFAVSGAMDGTPVILEGAPGVGKTFLAKAVSEMLGLPLVRVQFYEGISYDKILYDYDYQRQLLTIETIKSVIEKEMSGKSVSEALDAAKKIEFYGKDFLIERPVLRALNGKERCVLLLDELDKANEEVEYTLLETLDEFSISIPQYGTVTCPEEMRPIVFITSNNYRQLSDALRRRCNYLYIEQKTKEELLEILKLRAGQDIRIAEGVAECISKIQELPLKQVPSIAEAAAWANYLAGHKESLREKGAVAHTISMVAKDRGDVDMILRSGYLKEVEKSWM